MSDENGDAPPPPESTDSAADEAVAQEDDAPSLTEAGEGTSTDDAATTDLATESAESTESGGEQTTEQEDEAPELEEPAEEETTEDGDTPVLGPDEYPHGFESGEEASEFGQALNDGLDEAGYPETKAAFQGSSVTGVGYASGEPFGDHSDYDIALGGDDIFNAAKDAGIDLRSGGTRTGPLTPEQIDQLGLSDMHAQLEEMAGGREVNFMVHQDIDDALDRSPSMLVPRQR